MNASHYGCFIQFVLLTIGHPYGGVGVVCCFYVDGIYIKDGRILLVKRSCEPFKGFWHVVGGQVRKNEAFAEALTREFKEETSLDIEVGNVIGWRAEQSFDRAKIIVIFEVASAVGEIELNYENEDYAWFVRLPVNSVFDYSKYLVGRQQLPDS